jgi:ubiquinone/menaquinone biosynthesis C-methylase UbiE
MGNQINERFYRHFEKLAQEYPRYRKRFKYYWESIISHCNYYVHEDDSILEIGCGTGETLIKLKGKEKCGIDFSEKMIEVAKKRHPSLEFHVMDASNIHLEKKFDVIIISNVIGFFGNLLDVFESLKKVCHKRTRIIITYYSYLWEPVLRIGEWVGLKKKTPQQNWLSTKDIANLLYLSGFEAFKSSRGMLLPVYLPLISRLLNKYIAYLPLANYFCLNRYLCSRPIYPYEEEEKKEYTVSIIIPARNESGNIESAIQRIPSFGKSLEIIFVEGNSTDDTWKVINEIQKKYSSKHIIKIDRQDGKGKGDAVRKGFAIASGDIFMILDADLTVAPEDLPKFYNAIANGKGDFINGSRMIYPMEKEAMRFLNIIGNKFFSIAFSWILETPIKDTLCGTKVIFKKDYQKLIKNRSFFGDFDPFGDFDLIFGAHKLNLKIIDLPIRYQERVYGTTNISRFKHGLILLRMCAYAALKIKFLSSRNNIN